MILVSKKLFDEKKGDFRPGWMKVEKGRLQEISFSPLKGSTRAKDIVDVESAYVGPSGIDLHVHSRDFDESSKETFETLESQALKGGVSAIVCMANTLPRLDHVKRLKEFFARAKKMQIFATAFAAVTENLEGKKPTDWDELLKLPVAGLSDDGKPVLDEGLFRAAVKTTKKCGKFISLHEEDLHLSRRSLLHLSETSVRLGIEGSPAESEWAMVERDIRIAEEMKAHLHFGHMSSARSIALLRAAKRRGVSVSAELTPHHALLTVEEAEKFPLTRLSLMKVCPVIREKNDRQELWKGVLDGTLDCFATDHAPHTAFEKDQPMGCAAHGMLGLEYSFPLYNEFRHRAKLPWNTFFKAFAARPASLLQRSHEIGHLLPGREANFIVFDPLSTQKMHWRLSKSHNSPFEGRDVRGRILQHWIRGKKVYDVGL